jgi:hypothetical protein
LAALGSSDSCTVINFPLPPDHPPAAATADFYRGIRRNNIRAYCMDHRANDMPSYGRIRTSLRPDARYVLLFGRVVVFLGPTNSYAAPVHVAPAAAALLQSFELLFSELVLELRYSFLRA